MKKIAIIASVIGALASCATVKKDATQIASGVIDCSKQDLTQIVSGGQGLTLIGDVAQVIANGGQGWQQGLESIGLIVGEDALACAVKAVEQVFLAQSSTPTGPSTAMSPGVARAADEIIRKGWRYK